MSPPPIHPTLVFLSFAERNIKEPRKREEEEREGKGEERKGSGEGRKRNESLEEGREEG